MIIEVMAVLTYRFDTEDGMVRDKADAKQVVVDHIATGVSLDEYDIAVDEVPVV